MRKGTMGGVKYRFLSPTKPVATWRVTERVRVRAPRCHGPTPTCHVPDLVSHSAPGGRDSVAATSHIPGPSLSFPALSLLPPHVAAHCKQAL